MASAALPSALVSGSISMACSIALLGLTHTLLNKPAATRERGPSEAAYLRKRGGGQWRWQADVSYAAVLCDTFDLYALESSGALRQGWLACILAWVLILGLGVVLVAIAAAASAPGVLAVVPVMVLLVWGLGVFNVLHKRHALAQFMGTAAYLRELAVRVAAPFPPGREVDIVVHHLLLRYVEVRKTWRTHVAHHQARGRLRLIWQSSQPCARASSSRAPDAASHAHAT